MTRDTIVIKIKKRTSTFRYDFVEHDIRVKEDATIIMKQSDIVAVFPHKMMEHLTIEQLPSI